ncbi:hypothetical protein ACIPIN_01585 [Pseudomonas sp. NPDC087697]|uniref:hypothetical protein n=1 Tax=Pseudomonas sp. NPDC087697 TaxID=3364447 RepID=UPI003809E026
MSASKWAMLGLGLALGGCSWVGQMAQDSVEGATSYYSSDHFTLVVTVPANFGFTSKAQYSPKERQDCTVYSPGLGGSVTRQQQKSDKTVAKSTEQTLSTEIPLEYHIAGCAMEITRVDYEVDATYGSDAWDHDLDHAGGLAIVETASATTPDGTEQRGLCTWLFQISTAKAKKGEIEKILSCSAADIAWNVPEDRFKKRKPGGVAVRSELTNKTVSVTFRQSAKEKPSYQGYWFKAPDGWKPCTGRWGTEREELCTTPPKFRTFKMGVHECTVYPNCTEQGALND